MDRLTIFSENLRRECARYGSIASVCRKAKVNRQQFNKYLAGNSIPSAAVLQRICAALELKLDVLFTQAAVQPKAIKNPFEAQMHELTIGIFGNAIERYNCASTLRAGNYYCYFPLHRVPGALVRSLLQVREEGNFASFTRLTLFGNSKSNTGTIAKGRHRGLVLSNGSDIYLLGVNRYPPYQMSLMTIYANFTVSTDHHSGTIMTRSGNSHLASNFCLFPVPPKVTLRQIRSELGIVHEADLPSESLLLSSLMPQT